MSSSNLNRYIGSKDVTLKSRIPVPVRKFKNDIDNLQEKLLPISSECSLPKCVNMLQKVPGQLRNQPKKSANTHSQTVKLSKLGYSNKNSETPLLQSGSSLARLEQRRILKQVNSKVKSDVCNKNINSNLEIKSGLQKKGVISRINTKENNIILHKRPDPSKNNKKQSSAKNLKEIENVIPKVSAKKIGGILGKSSGPGKNDTVQEPTSEANEKEKAASKPNYIASQKDIKFEASDYFRNMILSNRELSPSILKLQSGLKLSSVFAERPSLYQKFEIPSNPFQEALKSIERGLSSAQKDRKASLIQQSSLTASPFKERNSFYSPHRNPKDEVMKSLEAFKTKQLLKKTFKSTKKVSFNLNVEEYAPRASLDYKQTPFKKSECRLTKINEKSEENTPNSPQNNINETCSTKQKNNQPITPELVTGVKELCANPEPKAISENIQNSQCVKIYSSDMFENIKLNTPIANSISISNDMQSHEVVPQCETLTKEIISNDCLREIHLKYLSPTSDCDNRSTLCATSLKDIRRMSFQNSVNLLDVKSSEARFYTPRPISMSKSRLVDVSSPDFFKNVAKGKFISNFAPIRTPLVLKNLAECLSSPEADLSPIRLKLNFTEEDKASPKKEALTKNFNLLTFENIMTTQKLLDELADQECHLWLVNENVPVVCGRYLQNPVALTLSEGDEMHFIPI